MARSVAYDRSSGAARAVTFMAFRSNQCSSIALGTSETETLACAAGCTTAG